MASRIDQALFEVRKREGPTPRVVGNMGVWSISCRTVSRVSRMSSSLTHSPPRGLLAPSGLSPSFFPFVPAILSASPPRSAVLCAPTPALCCRCHSSACRSTARGALQLQLGGGRGRRGRTCLATTPSCLPGSTCARVTAIGPLQPPQPPRLPQHREGPQPRTGSAATRRPARRRSNGTRLARCGQAGPASVPGFRAGSL